jgi:hypothetical protein
LLNWRQASPTRDSGRCATPETERVRCAMRFAYLRFATVCSASPRILQ